MAIIKNLFGIREIKKTVFYKEFSEENKQLSDLIELSNKVKSEKKEYIDRDIAFLKAGLKGEENVYFELKNSFIPMICLHDIRIEEDDYVAQLDFVLVTAQFIMILETKKLNGDIYINEYGDFTRSIKNKYGKVIKKEGVYSPIEQNNRHVRIVKDYLIRKGVIKTLDVISGVVIANPKSIVNRSKAPWKIKNEIVKYDQLTNFINKKISKYEKDKNLFEDRMKKIANALLESNTEVNIDYYKKYSLTEEDFIEKVEVIDNKSIEKEEVINEEKAEVIKSVEENNICNTDEIINKLKEFRLNKSRELKIKPYFIFNNETLDEIIKLNPKSKKELINVRGFGPKKIEDYGEEIIKIINFK